MSIHETSFIAAVPRKTYTVEQHVIFTSASTGTRYSQARDVVLKGTHAGGALQAVRDSITRFAERMGMTVEFGDYDVAELAA